MTGSNNVNYKIKINIAGRVTADFMSEVYGYMESSNYDIESPRLFGGQLYDFLKILKRIEKDIAKKFKDTAGVDLGKKISTRAGQVSKRSLNVKQSFEAICDSTTNNNNFSNVYSLIATATSLANSALRIRNLPLSSAETMSSPGSGFKTFTGYQSGGTTIIDSNVGTGHNLKWLIYFASGFNTHGTPNVAWSSMAFWR